MGTRSIGDLGVPWGKSGAEDRTLQRSQFFVPPSQFFNAAPVSGNSCTRNETQRYTCSACPLPPPKGHPKTFSPLGMSKVMKALKRKPSTARR